MRTLLTVIALVFAIAIAHAQPAPVAPQTTVLYGYVYRTNLSAAAGAIIITERTIPLASQPFVIGQAQRRDTANAAGFISMRVLRNSIVYISAADRAGYLGIPASPGAVRITIPDADSVMLVTDTSTIAIPQTHVIARPLLTLSDGITSGAISALTITGSSVGSVTFNGASASIVLNGGASTDYGDSIHVADSLARMRRVFISRLSTAITLDSSTDAAGRIYYTVSLDPDSVQAWLRDSSMTWMLGRVVQLADSGIAERGYMTPTQIRTLLAGYSVTGHVHAIADVTGLATALGDTASYRDRMTKVEGSLAVILDTINAVRGRLATVVTDLNTHIGAADAHLPSQTGQAGKALYTDGSASGWQSVPVPDLSPYATIAQLVDSLIAVYSASGRKLPWARIDTTGSGIGVGGGAFTGLLPFTLYTPTRSWLVYDTTKADSSFTFGPYIPSLRSILYRRPYSFSTDGGKWWIGNKGSFDSPYHGPSISSVHEHWSGIVISPASSAPFVRINGQLQMYNGGSNMVTMLRNTPLVTPSSLAQFVNTVSLFADTVKTGPGGISAPTSTVSAKTIVGDSSIAGVRVIDTTRRVSAVGDSITFILTEIRAPLSPAKGRKSGYIVFDFTSELPYGFGGSGIMMHTIIADTASGVRIEAASYNTWGTRDGNPDYSFHAEQTLFWASHAKTTKATTGFAQDATWTMRTPGSTQQSRWNMRLNTTYIYQNLMVGRVTIRYTMPQGNNSISPIRVVGGWI